MPVRMLRESILDSDAVNSLTPQAEVFYRRLMSVVDDFGRFDGRLSILRGRLYALQIDRVREADLERWIAECVKAGLVRFYTVAAKPYLLFHKLGNPRAGESKWPAPPVDSEQTQTDANGCAQTHASAPYSYSDTRSKSGSDTRSRPPPKAAAAPVISLPIPEVLQTEEFQAVWPLWLQHAVEKGKPVLQTAGTQALAELAAMGPTEAVRAIRHSMKKQYDAIFPAPPERRRPQPELAPAGEEMTDEERRGIDLLRGKKCQP